MRESVVRQSKSTFCPKVYFTILYHIFFVKKKEDCGGVKVSGVTRKFTSPLHFSYPHHIRTLTTTCAKQMWGYLIVIFGYSSFAIHLKSNPKYSIMIQTGTKTFVYI